MKIKYRNKYVIIKNVQAGDELCQAQFKLGLAAPV